MAIGEYRGVNNVARKIVEEHRGVANVARKITRQYRGVANIARKFFDTTANAWRKTWWTTGTNVTVDDWSVTFNDSTLEVYLKTTSTLSSSTMFGTACAQYESEVDLGGKTLTIAYSYVKDTTGHGLGIISYRNASGNEMSVVYLYATNGDTDSYTIPSGTYSIDFRIDQSAEGTHESTLTITQLEIDGESII